MKTARNSALPMLLIFMCIFSVYTALCDNVNINTAKNVALNLYSERSSIQVPNIGISKILEEKEKGETMFYVMVYSDIGFAIISADDIVKPVLGYSFESYYSENNHSPAFELYILKRLKRQIYHSRQENVLPDSETILDWQYYSVTPSDFSPKNIVSSEPLLTTLWRQGWPYNAHCPEDTAGPGGHALVGCVATAMAQVLNYWQHPWHGTGSHSYTPEDHPEYGELTANFDSTFYNFDNMPDIAMDYSADLAELNYHCAVAVDMNFGPDASGAWGWGNNDVRDAFQNYFYMDNSGNDLNRSSYVSSTWIQKMKDNLDLLRPVIYGARDNQEDKGHAWVLDAYTTGNMFHCNWGWGGQDNGFYSIDNFNPPIQDRVYDVWEHASVNIFPFVGHVNGTYTQSGSPYYINYNIQVDPGSQLTIEPGVELFVNGRYGFTVYGQFNAIGTYSDSIYITTEHPEIGWRGIRFYNSDIHTPDSSKIIYCNLENGVGKHEPLHNADSLTSGGAIYCYTSSRILVANSIVENNRATFGGGVACYYSDIHIKNCTIKNNIANESGGGLWTAYSDLTINNNDIYGNDAGYSGGGLYWAGPIILMDTNTIRNNTAGNWGGGLAISNASGQLNKISVFDNHALLMGGGIGTMNSSLELTDCHIFENLADQGGGFNSQSDVLIHLNKSIVHHNLATHASALYIQNGDLELTNATIAYNNEFSDQEGIILEDGNLTSLNSILWHNAENEITTTGISNVHLSYSLIDNGYWPGNDNTYSDPLFADPANDDFQLSWLDYPLPDGGKSAAIDAGDPSSPVDPDGTRTDIGAIPFEQVYTTVPAGTINGTLTCTNSPYYIDGDLEIPSTDELIIEPCVKVIFRGDYQFEVYGRLLAQGTETDPIIFSASDTIEGWQGIRFINTHSNGQDSSKLEYCRITFGNADGWFTNDKRGGALFFNSSGDVLVKNCLINKNRAALNGGAVYSTGASSPLFLENIFEYNSAPSGGVLFGNSAGTLPMTNNLMQYNNAVNGGAIYSISSNIQLSGNTIKHNKAEEFGGAIHYASGAAFTFDPTEKNNVYLNYAGGAGLDLYFGGNPLSMVDVVFDTFTVLNPHKHFAYPYENFNISLDNHVIDQVDSDLYVSQSGSDENSGISPAEPLRTLYMANMKILAGEMNSHSIYLSDGTYSEGASNEVFPVNLREYVSLIGESTENTVIYGENKNQLLFGYDDTGFSIDSLTLQGGYGDYGGGLRLESGSSPSVSYVEIKSNIAEISGGGVYCDRSSPHFNEVEIYDDSSASGGGGMSFYYECDPVLINTYIHDNISVYSGGGIKFSYYCEPVIDSCSILNNTSAHGGGISMVQGCNGTIKNTLINRNDALSHVSGYFGTGGAANISYSCDPIMENVEMQFNHADWDGGGLYSYAACNGRLVNCKFYHNSAFRGGGLFLSGSVGHKFYNTVLHGNTSIEGQGGAIYNSASPQFYNATITGNVSDTIYGGGAVYNTGSTPEFYNSILWDNFPNEIEITSGSVNASYSNIEGGYAGAGNINADPMLTYILYLEDGSPCINAGNPDTTGMNLPLTDIIDSTRIVDVIIDMGAFEYNGISHFTELEIKVLIEGPFNGTTMNTSLNDAGLVPLNHPYNQFPWDYSGTESVSMVPDNAVDWVLLEIRDAMDTGSATTATIVGQQAVFLLNDGTISGLDGISVPWFQYTPVDQLFVVIWHRNHLGIMSAYPLTESGGVYSYDFTTPAGQAYGSGSQKDLGSGVYGLFGGDGDADGIVDTDDKTTTWSTESGKTGYLNGDFNLDSQVNNYDKNSVWIPNIGKGSSVPE